MNNYPTLVFFGHHKCASTWMCSLLMDVRKLLGYTVTHFASTPTAQLDEFVLNPGDEMAVILNSRHRYTRKMDRYRGIHLIRDPRDIIVSAYFSHKISHPLFSAIEDMRVKLQKVPKEEGLLQEIDFLRPMFEDIYEWNYQDDDIFEMKYEDATRNTGTVLESLRFLGLTEHGYKEGAGRRIKAFLNKLNNRGLYPVRYRDLKVSEETVIGIIQGHSFKNMAGGRMTGQEDVKSHYRKGMPGDWKVHFTPVLKAYFKEKYGDLLVKLGYESNNEW